VIAAVTGASGFVGSHLVDALAARGWRVRRLARPESPTPPPGAPPAVETHVVDLADARALDRAPALEGVDVVFHVGGVTKRRTLEAFRDGNVRPTRALLDALARRGARPRFVHVSSQAAAGPASRPDVPVTEDDAPRPVEAYGRSKLEAEEAVRAADLPWTIVRPSAVYGPRDVDFLTAFRHARRGLAVSPAPRGARLSLVYAEDLADALALAGASPAAAGRTYFVAAADAAWRDVYAAAAAAFGARLRAELVPPAWALRLGGRLGDAYGLATGRHPLANSHKVTLGLQRWWLCSAERARRELAWAPRVALAEGARRTAAWYRAAGWL
jgi:nucleoside-diphosphate-sugar epimerase